MGRVTELIYLLNQKKAPDEEEREAYRSERRQHYGMDEIGDKEYWRRIEEKVADSRKKYNPRYAPHTRTLSQEAFEGLERFDVPR